MISHEGGIGFTCPIFIDIFNGPRWCLSDFFTVNCISLCNG